MRRVFQTYRASTCIVFSKLPRPKVVLKDPGGQLENAPSPEHSTLIFSNLNVTKFIVVMFAIHRNGIGDVFNSATNLLKTTRK